MRQRVLLSTVIAALIALLTGFGEGSGALAAPAPAPFEAPGQTVDWLFVFKLNAAVFPSTETIAARTCPFGGAPEDYHGSFSQHFVSASSSHPQLAEGQGLVGASDNDPLAATFGEIYNGDLNFVVWNDQFYQDPKITGCSDSCGAPWGHSKGILAWNGDGEGMLIQVTTPSWPGAGSSAFPRRKDGNTLGCVHDNDVKVSQHFFALRLSENDVEQVLYALATASVVTDVANPQLVKNGGPAAIQARVQQLGVRSDSIAPFNVLLSSGVRLIAKPSKLQVPAWQFVSSQLGGVDLRTATWWTAPKIPTTTASTPISCWDGSLPKSGAVEIATSGQWAGKAMKLTGGPAADGNHAKIGISRSGTAHYSIFGDMNQQGALSGNCKSSQNGRGGLFFAVDNETLQTSVAGLISGDTASQ